MEDREVVINLIIDGVSYPLTVPVREEPYYRDAARLINETLTPYKQAFSGEGSVRVITMVAIDIAYRLATKTDDTGLTQTMRKITELSNLVGDTLKAEE